MNIINQRKQPIANLSYKINDGYLKQSHDHEVYWMEVLHLSGVDCPKWWHGNMKAQPWKLFKFIGTSWARPIWVWITVWIKITFLKYPPPETKNCPEPSWASKIYRWHCIQQQHRRETMYCWESDRRKDLTLSIGLLRWALWISLSRCLARFHGWRRVPAIMVPCDVFVGWGCFLFQCLRQGCCVLSAVAVTCTFIEGFFRVVLLYNVSRSQSAILPQFSQKTCNIWMIFPSSQLSSIVPVFSWSLNWLKWCENWNLRILLMYHVTWLDESNTRTVHIGQNPGNEKKSTIYFCFCIFTHRKWCASFCASAGCFMFFCGFEQMPSWDSHAGRMG